METSLLLGKCRTRLCCQSCPAGSDITFQATLVGFGAIGGIVGTTVFRSQDAPEYVPGLSVAMGAQVVIVLLVVALTLDFKRQNGKAERGLKVLEEGDKNFRYTY